MPITYAICTMQRSGSNLLCDIIRKRKDFGMPYENFHETQFLKKIHLNDPIDEIINTLLKVNTSENGAKGVKLMYDQIPRLVNLINKTQHTNHTSQEAFDICNFDKHIFLYRKNTLRQAISLYKAQTTHLWRSFPGKKIDSKIPTILYDKFQIQRCLNLTKFREKQWHSFFKENNITPLVISYEDLTENKQETLLKVFNYLGDNALQTDFQFPETILHRQADELSEEFYTRFQTENSLFGKIIMACHNFFHQYCLKYDFEIFWSDLIKDIKKTIHQAIKTLVPMRFEGYYQYLLEYYRHKGKVVEKVATVDYHGKQLDYSYQGLVENKCIFFHIPKTAGISVSLALFGNLGGGHENAQFYKCLFGKSFDSYYKFAFVRNPYTRLVSAYEYVKNGNSAFGGDKLFKKQVLDKYETFDDFVQFWLKDNFHKSRPHFRTQFSYINLNGKVVVDFLGRYETLNEDFQKVAEHLNIETNLPTENVTQYDKRSYYEKYYSNEKTVAVVQKIYSDDFETFGYSTDANEI